MQAMASAAPGGIRLSGVSKRFGDVVALDDVSLRLPAGKDVPLLDEPFGALDAITRAELQAWLRDALHAEPRTTALVTHDVDEALLVCDRIAVMSARPGRVVLELDGGFGGGERAETIASRPFLEARGRALEALR